MELTRVFWVSLFVICFDVAMVGIFKALLLEKDKFILALHVESIFAFYAFGFPIVDDKTKQ